MPSIRPNKTSVAVEINNSSLLIIRKGKRPKKGVEFLKWGFQINA